LKLHGGKKMAISIPQEATKAQAQPIAPNFDRFVADRAKTAKSELSDVVLTKDMTREERRSAFLAAIGR
jgi:hypothetical protein